jgi:hypothetical protein
VTIIFSRIKCAGKGSQNVLFIQLYLNVVLHTNDSVTLDQLAMFS